jgi:hypothetical protein
MDGRYMKVVSVSVLRTGPVAVTFAIGTPVTG